MDRRKSSTAPVGTHASPEQYCFPVRMTVGISYAVRFGIHRFIHSKTLPYKYVNGMEADLWTSFGKIKLKEILVLPLVGLYRNCGLNAGLPEQRKRSGGAKLRFKTPMWSSIQESLTGW
jgi:hypothetical protein